MPALPAHPPDETLSILDEVMRLPGAQAHHYAVVRRMLIDGLPLKAYSLSQLQTLTGKSMTTCKGIRRWLTAQMTHGELRVFADGQNPDPGQDSDPWLVPSSETAVPTVQLNHGAESRPGSESCLAVQKLLEIGWGQREGRQVQDPEALVRTHGQEAVLTAVEQATHGEVRNPAAFVSWCLRRQQGRDAMAIPTASPPAAPPTLPVRQGSALPATETSPAPKTPPELQPVLDWLQQKVRPQSWNSWFVACRLTLGAEPGVVQFWTDNPYAVDWIEAHYGDLITQGVHQVVGSGIRVAFEAYDSRQVRP